MNGLLLYKGLGPTNKELDELSKVMPHLNLKKRRLGGNIKTTIDPFYKFTALDWKWFRSLFTKDTDVKVVMLTKNDLKKASIHNHLGFYSIDDDTKHDFYITALDKLDSRAKKNGFKSSFVWMFVHEYLHGSVWQNTKDRYITASLVHQWEEQGLLRQKIREDVEEWYNKKNKVLFLQKQLKKI